MSAKKNTNSPLLDGFTKPGIETWRALAEDQLKGASFDKKLVTRTSEGIAIQPLYTAADVADISPDYLPGMDAKTRASDAAGYFKEPWHIAQGLPLPTPTAYNRTILADLKHGQNAVNIQLDVATLAGQDPDAVEPKDVGCCGVSLASVADFEQLLEGVIVAAVPLYMHAGISALPLGSLLLAWAEKHNIPLDQLTGSLENDPLAILSQAGKLPCSFEDCMDATAAWTEQAAQQSPNLKTIGVSALGYGQNGAHRAQELAYALATGVEYIRHVIQRGLTIDRIAPRMRFHFSISSHVFLEMAKLRAARKLWHHIIQQWGGSDAVSGMTIHGRTTLWNKTTSDPYNNMLRVSCETFAGILGGCQSLHTGTFDETLKTPNDFSRRIARNAQIVLKEEFGLADVMDPGGGSYYLETLTDELARQAWTEFQTIEKQGGMLAALQQGTVQHAVSANADAAIDKLNKRRDVLVGANQYAIPPEPLPDAEMDLFSIANERVADITAYRREHSDIVAAALAKAADKTDLTTLIALAQAGATLGQLTEHLQGASSQPLSIQPIQSRRLARQYEGLHQAAAQYKATYGHYPKIFLANMGPVGQHKPRADFSQQFFAAGGFEVIYPNGFATPEEAAQAAVDSDAQITVICSTDDTYPDLVGPFIQHVKKAKAEIAFILAGDPGEQADAYAAAGLDDHISIRTDNYQFLAKYLTQLGVLS